MDRPDPHAPRSGAVLLAGGLSSRMGQPKAWLPWRGRPLLLHLLELLAPRCPLRVVVGAAGQELPPLPEGVLRVDDPPGERQGPLLGLSLGLDALHGHADLAFLGACDGVFLSDAHVAHVLAALHDPAVDAAIPEDPPDPADPARRLAHPLASAVRVAPARALAHDLLAAGVRRPLALFERLATRWIPVAELPDPRALATCNTPEEYAAARAERGAR